MKPGDLAALSGAYGRLIEAAGGGTLGLFTAIQRLKAVHSRIADRLARAGLPLLAQHVDPIDPGTLVDIFRDDPRASLLGTDALRDGVDVPGESLRLVVMERVPWPRPTVLHAARRMAGGGSAYDDAVVRARLAQAFGRLIRREGDRGTFVILSAAMPSRLLSAFPAGVPDPAGAARRGDRSCRRGWREHAGATNRAGAVKTLFLLRHAKSDWGDSSLKDFDRPLNERGWDAAKTMGQEMRERDLAPDFVLSSPSARTTETLARVEEGFGREVRDHSGPAHLSRRTETLVELVRSAPAKSDRLMIVGHNPGMHELVLALAQVRPNCGTKSRTNFPPRRWPRSASTSTIGRTLRPARVPQKLPEAARPLVFEQGREVVADRLQPFDVEARDGQPKSPAGARRRPLPARQVAAIRSLLRSTFWTPRTV